MVAKDFMDKLEMDSWEMFRMYSGKEGRASQPDEMFNIGKDTEMYLCGGEKG